MDHPVNVCVRGDLAGGAIQASAASTIGGIPIALRGDAVASHAPCPIVPSHCAAAMTATVASHMNGVPVVVAGDPATCGHGAVSTTGVTITDSPGAPPPAAPAAPMVTAAPLAIGVSWGAVARATGYRVEWRSGDEEYDVARQAVVTGLSYTIPDLVAGTEYSVRVIATRGAADSAPSAEVTATPLADSVTLTAPGSSYIAARGFLAQWNGNFGALPARWFADGADTSLRFVGIDGQALGGTFTIDIGAAGRNDLLAAVRGSLRLTIAAAGVSVTVTGIGGADTREPYDWVPSNSDEMEAFLAVVSARRNLEASFTFVRGD